LTRNLCNKPDWLQLEQYDFAKDLDAAGWHAELSIRVRYKADWRYTITEAFPEAQWLPEGLQERFWNTYLERIKTHFGEQSSPGRSKPRIAVEEVEPNDELLYVYMAHDTSRLLLINGAASSADIRRAFSAWLDQQPRGPLRRRGPRGLGDTYTPEHGYRWHQKRILAILDIELWCAIFNHKEPTHLELANWLAPNRPKNMDGKVWGREARDALKDALKAMHALPYAK
jgi:hypothetical protein